VGLRCSRRTGSTLPKGRHPRHSPGIVGKLTTTTTTGNQPKTPRTSRIGSRPHITCMGTVGRGGLAHGAWRAITTSGVLGLSPAPWRLCPTCETVPVSCWGYLRGHLRGAGAISGHPCGGIEAGPNRADAWRSLKPPYIGWGYLRMYGG
jgi:hypothetical protein